MSTNKSVVKKKILILGYYGKSNLGDDVFEYIFKKYFERYTNPDFLEISIKSMDEIDVIPKDTFRIIFGGGDLINEYFINRLHALNIPKICPTYAISIGIPYPKLIDEGYLDSFDAIIHRNLPDAEALQQRYNCNNCNNCSRVKHFPDISMLLSKYCPNQELTYINPASPESKRIIICLSRHMYSERDPSKYNTIINNLALFFYKLSIVRDVVEDTCCPCISVGCLPRNRLNRLNRLNRSQIVYPRYELVFVPFCSNTKQDQNDNIINRDIYGKMLSLNNNQTLTNVKLFTKKIPIDQILPVFNSCWLTIATRFHAHMFSLMCNVPIVSIYSSRKVGHLLEELNMLELGYKLDVDEQYLYPVSLDIDVLMRKFETIINYYDKIKNKFAIYNELSISRMNLFENVLKNLIFYDIQSLGSDEEINASSLTKSKEIISSIAEFYDKELSDEEIDAIINTDGGMKSLVPYLDIKSDIDIPNQLAEIVSFKLTKNRISDYNYGISENILSDSYNLYESCKWILLHQQSHHQPLEYGLLENVMPIKYRKINMNYIDQHTLRGYHRSGWNYVMHFLENLHNPSTDAPIFDSYLDKTFGWDYDFLSRMNIIPYRRPWVGVFHHTPNEDYTDYNLVKVFGKPKFIESLGRCKLLIVFSNYLKEWLTNKLSELSLDDITVLSLFHPTQLVDECLQFNYPKYHKNDNKKIIHIGAWLRNTYSIYELEVPKRFKKYALKGKEMDNYFIDDDIFSSLEGNVVDSCQSHDNNHVVSRALSKTKTTNKYILGMMKSIKTKFSSVTIIDMLSNEEYDELLTENVVFIDLVDASAVNTLIECIVRNTPILVNRLPATEEYLGVNYPLFYKNLHHATELLSKESIIISAHIYLKSLDKSKFDVKYFMQNLLHNNAFKNL
jgi:hypothetical protein